MIARPPPPLGGRPRRAGGPSADPGRSSPVVPLGPQPAPGPRGAFETEPRRPGAPDAVGRPARRRRLRSPAWATPNYASRHRVWPPGIAPGGPGCSSVLANDPSAGSPTETLLRLLLPLNATVWSSSRQPGRVIRQANSPRTSLKRSIGSSDGRCVQRAGT